MLAAILKLTQIVKRAFRLNKIMDELAEAKADLDDNPNNQEIIKRYNACLDAYREAKNKSR